MPFKFPNPSLKLKSSSCRRQWLWPLVPPAVGPGDLNPSIHTVTPPTRSHDGSDSESDGLCQGTAAVPVTNVGPNSESELECNLKAEGCFASPTRCARSFRVRVTASGPPARSGFATAKDSPAGPATSEPASELLPLPLVLVPLALATWIRV